MNTIDIKGTVITLGPTDYPGADAQVHIDNQPMNDERDNGTFVLDFDGLSVDTTFIWHPGADEILIIPPDGYICVPSCSRLIEETFNWTIYLMPFVGM